MPAHGRWKLLAVMIVAVVVLGVVGWQQFTAQPARPMTTTITPTITTVPSARTTVLETPSKSFPTPEELHMKLWMKALELAKSDVYCRYALYTSRVLTVKFPETYLKANLIKAQSYPLTLTVDRLKEYSIIGFRSIYPENYPVFPYLDRRAFPIFLMLHSDPKVSTQIDMANSYYAMARIEGIAKEELFVIYCENENTYVIKNREIISMETLKAVEKIDGRALLIFNEEYVWYPLMQRDDRAISPSLKRVVEAFSKEGAVPALTDFEKQVIDELRQITGEVRKENALRIAEISWHNDPDAIKFKDFARKTLHTTLLLKIANYLSPIPTYLATVSASSPFESRMRSVADEYLSHISKHNYLPNPGDETENTADSSYYMRAAACGPKSFLISTVLDIIRIENYVISGKDLGTSGHYWVYVKPYNLIINNAKIKERNTIIATGGPAGSFKLIESVANGTQAISFAWVDDRFESRGNMPPLIVADLIAFAKSKYGDDLGGINWAQGKRLAVPYEELVGQLREYAKSWKPPTDL